LIAALALAGVGSARAEDAGRTAEYQRLRVGTVLKVRLDAGLNSAQARSGQRFTATVQPEEDRSGLPAGTQVVGVIREARAATKEQPGVLDVDFTSLEFPTGRAYPITGELTSLDAKSVSRTADGRLVAKQQSNNNNRMKFIGYGAGAGAVIALLTKGDVLTNALLGAAGGYLYDLLRKDRAKGRYANVDLKEGAEFGVRLDQQFAFLPVSERRTDRVPRAEEALGSLYRDDDAARSRRDRVSERDRAVRRAGAGIEVSLESGPVNFGAARPMREGNTVMVPAAPVLRAAGVRYFYNPLTRELSVGAGTASVRATVGSTVAIAGGTRVQMEEPVRSIEGVIYVPDRFLELATGLRMSWDEEDQTLRLTRSGLDRDRGLVR
jgi:hypothetical protein